MDNDNNNNNINNNNNNTNLTVQQQELQELIKRVSNVKLSKPPPSRLPQLPPVPQPPTTPPKPRAPPRNQTISTTQPNSNTRPVDRRTLTDFQSSNVSRNKNTIDKVVVDDDDEYLFDQRSNKNLPQQQQVQVQQQHLQQHSQMRRTGESGSNIVKVPLNSPPNTTSFNNNNFVNSNNNINSNNMNNMNNYNNNNFNNNYNNASQTMAIKPIMRTDSKSNINTNNNMNNNMNNNININNNMNNMNKKYEKVTVNTLRPTTSDNKNNLNNINNNINVNNNNNNYSPPKNSILNSPSLVYTNNFSKNITQSVVVDDDISPPSPLNNNFNHNNLNNNINNNYNLNNSNILNNISDANSSINFFPLVDPNNDNSQNNNENYNFTINNYNNNNLNNNNNINNNNNNNNNINDKVKRQSTILEMLDDKWSEEDLFSEISKDSTEEDDVDDDEVPDIDFQKRNSSEATMTLLEVDTPDVTMFAHFEDEEEESNRMSVRRTSVKPGVWEGWQRRIKRQTWEEWELKISSNQSQNANNFLSNSRAKVEVEIHPIARIKKEIDGRAVAPYWLFKWWLTKNTTNRPTISKHPLLELLLEDNLLVVTALTDLLKNEELNKCAFCLIRIFDGCGKVLRLINHFIQREIDQTTHENTLFRNNTILTKLITSYAKIAGSKFLRNLLGPIINDLIQSPPIISCIEIDSKKLIDPSLIKDQVDRLLELTQRFLDKIIEQIESIPFVIRQICHCLYVSTEKKFPDCAKFGVASFIFLRFICPAIVAPDSFGIIKNGSLSVGVRRTLVLVSKILQNLSNGIKTSKESYMKPTDIFLIKNYDLIQSYFQKISTIPQITDEQKKNGFSIIPIPLLEESLSIVHHIIIKEIESIKDHLINAEVVETVSYNISENLQTVLLKSCPVIELLKTKKKISTSSPLFKPKTLLIDSIMASGCAVIRSLFPITGNTIESEQIAEALMVIVHAKGNSLGYIKSHIIKEVKEAASPRHAFSGYSISNLLIWGYIKALNGDFLSDSWKDLIKIINDSNHCLDIDPNRVGSHEDESLQKRIKDLSDICQPLALRVFENGENIHSRIKELCDYIQSQMVKKFGAAVDPHFAARLFFEKNFVNAMSCPLHFYLIFDSPNVNARKTFQIASLFLRCCITGNLFQENDYLSSLNSAVLACRKQAVSFLTSITTLNNAPPSADSFELSWDLFCNSLIYIHTQLNRYLPQVINNLNDSCIEETIVYNIFDRLASVIALYRYKLRRKTLTLRK